MTSISTGTSAFHDRAMTDIGSLRARAEGLQQQIARGERLARSSDDPVAASRLRTLARADSLAAIDKAGADRVGTDLALTDSAMSSMADLIGRAQELATRAANGTLNDDQRASIGSELQQINQSLFALANARDSVGHALFGGQAAGEAYVLDAAGNALYAGTGSAGTLAVGEGPAIQRGMTGPDFLNFTVNGQPTSLLAEMKVLADALQGGAADPAGAARNALGSLEAGLESVTTAQTIVGARLAWIDLAAERRIDMAELRASEEAEIGAADLASTIANLQQVMLVLDASQASFVQIARLSLFDRLN